MMNSMLPYVSPQFLIPKNVSQTYVYACLTGIMLGFAFPPMHFGFLAFFALVPLFLVIESELLKPKGSFLRYLYLAYFLYQGIANWWVGSWQKESDPFLIIAGLALQFGHPFFLMLPLICLVYVRKRLNMHIAYVLLPFIYVAYEWLHSLTDASYPWLSLGYMALSIPLIDQSADIFGVWGLTFLFVSIQVLIFFILKQASKRSIQLSLIAIAVLLLITILYGKSRLQEINELTTISPTISVGIVQPNINPWNKWEGEVRDQIFIHKSTMQIVKNKQPDLWLWSETAIPFMNIPLNVQKDFSGFRSVIGSTPVLTGFAHLELVKNPESEPLSKPFRLIPGSYYVAYNAAALVQDSSVLIHKKMKLTPFGEGFPFSQDIPWLGSILQWGVGISGWKKGEVQQPLILKKQNNNIASIGTVICIESIYPDFVRRYAQSGANVLMVITNDAWFDNSPGPMQHFAISQMRAIENRRSIARCGNTGVSGIIHPDGSIAQIASPQVRTAIIGDVPIVSMKSLYSEIGDILPIFSSFLALFALTFAGYRGFLQRRMQ